MSVAAVIVTHNRRDLLKRCLTAIVDQSYQLNRVFVVDNASTDGTDHWLDEWLPIQLPQARLLALNQNSGGAGGFATGLRAALEEDCDWIWMMDDDACPKSNALKELIKVAKSPNNIYGSLAVSGEHTSWPTTLLDENRVAHFAMEVPAEARVESIPLLGFFIHRDLVQRIGYPDSGFFIAADDIEYCARARCAGAGIIIAGNSRIEHPRIAQQEIHVLGAKIIYLSLPPWKRYYDTRNRLLIARKYYGLKLLTQTIPGSFVRLFAAMLKEPRKLAQLWAWCCGTFDGLLEIKGKRHEKWGIRP